LQWSGQGQVGSNSLEYVIGTGTVGTFAATAQIGDVTQTVSIRVKPIIDLTPENVTKYRDFQGTVTIHATVYPEGHDGELVWDGEGTTGANPLDRLVSLAQIGNFEVLANTGEGTESKSAVVHVMAAPTQFRITLNAYIPYDNIDDPLDLCCNNPIDFGHQDLRGIGDGRGFVTTRDPRNLEDRSVKVSDLMYLLNYYNEHDLSIYPNDGPQAYTSATQIFVADSFDSNGALTDEALNDWELGDGHLKVGWALGLLESDGCHDAYREEIGGLLRTFITCRRISPNGIYWWVPGLGIEYAVDINVAMVAPDQVNYAIVGCHKNYPMYQFWIGEHLVYSDEDHEVPLWLFLPCEYSTGFEEVGNVTIQ
jgi:hypothetical protein